MCIYRVNALYSSGEISFWISTYLSEKCFLLASFDDFLDDPRGFSSVSDNYI